MSRELVNERSPVLTFQLKADHSLFDWLINCVILNHFEAIKS